MVRHLRAEARDVVVADLARRLLHDAGDVHFSDAPLRQAVDEDRHVTTFRSWPLDPLSARAYGQGRPGRGDVGPRRVGSATSRRGGGSWRAFRRAVGAHHPVDGERLAAIVARRPELRPAQGAKDEVRLDASGALRAGWTLLNVLEHRLRLKPPVHLVLDGGLGAHQHVQQQSRDIEDGHEQHGRGLFERVRRACPDVAKRPDDGRGPHDEQVQRQ